MDIETTFKARLVDHTGEGTLTDGGVLWEIALGDERVASCTDEQSATNLEMRLNNCLSNWRDENPADRTVDA